jgi:hypothetical protein
MYIVEARPTPSSKDSDTGFYFAGAYRDVERTRLGLTELLLAAIDDDEVTLGEARRITNVMQQQVGQVAIGLSYEDLQPIAALTSKSGYYLELRADQYTAHASQGGMSGGALGRQLHVLNGYADLADIQPLTHQGYAARIGTEFTITPVPLASDEPERALAPSATHRLMQVPLRFGADGLPRIEEGEPQSIPGILTVDGRFEAVAV